MVTQLSVEYEEIRKEGEGEEFALLWKDFEAHWVLLFSWLSWVFGVVPWPFPVVEHMPQSTRAQ